MDHSSRGRVVTEWENPQCRLSGGKPNSARRRGRERNGDEIALTDASGARLELSLPPARLDAFRDLSGKPNATYTPSEGRAVTLGACGSLTLTGEDITGPAGARRAERYRSRVRVT